MTTLKKWKTRIMRQFVKRKEDIIAMTFGFVVLIFICIGLYHVGSWGIRGIKYCYHAYIKDDLYDLYNDKTQISDNCWFYENGANGYIKDSKTGKKALKGVSWVVIGSDEEKDTLACFASNGYRGYLNRRTGEVVVPADRYKKAWIFSEGLAAVMEADSTLKFINPVGEVVIDSHCKFAPLPLSEDYIFKNGLCPLMGTNHRWGLINKKGRWAVMPQYECIEFTNRNCWIVKKDGHYGLLDDSLRLVVSPSYKEVLVRDCGIELLNNDYVRQLLDFKGNIVQDFMYTDIEDLYYKTNVINPDYEEYDWALSPYKQYSTTYCSSEEVRVGLLGPDGVPVTPPLYTSIEAVNDHCFRCFYSDTFSEGLSVLINTQGHVIK